MIILEDDCVPRKEFFEFMIKSLNKYKKYNNLGAICGYQFPDLNNLRSDIINTYFTKNFNSWGNGIYWISFSKSILKKRI